ncbi:hypothetical protein C1646_768719 [Rhizophagus diaphanus]|nr:hypothetical protein C1646_768719 [Rhizophagus diaphanus] [Rhizophagus sp. MUCL 43196]
MSTQSLLTPEIEEKLNYTSLIKSFAEEEYCDLGNLEGTSRIIIKPTAENKINKTINKRKMENIARTATSVTAEACSISDGCELPNDARKLMSARILTITRNNISSDLNVEPELSESIAVQEQFKEYPEQESLNDEWILPFGRSIHEIICGPRSLHKSHPLCLEIIRVDSKIWMPDWIEEGKKANIRNLSKDVGVKKICNELYQREMKHGYVSFTGRLQD